MCVCVCVFNGKHCRNPFYVKNSQRIGRVFTVCPICTHNYGARQLFFFFRSLTINREQPILEYNLPNDFKCFHFTLWFVFTSVYLFETERASLAIEQQENSDFSLWKKKKSSNKEEIFNNFCKWYIKLCEMCKSSTKINVLKHGDEAE